MMSSRDPPDDDPVAPISGRPMPACVAAGVAVWLGLSVVPFAGLAGCWLAGYCRRSVPLRDALAGTLTGAIGVLVAGLIAAAVGPIGMAGLPLDPLSLGMVLATVFDRSALAAYLSIAYVAFFATIGALLGVLGGYYGSDGYGDNEAAHRRAIALGRSYRSQDRADPSDESDGSSGGRPSGENQRK